MIIETDIPTYEKLKNCMSEWRPDIEIELLATDPAFQSLGFSDTIPCTIEIKATEDEILELMDAAMDLETSAYMAEDDPKATREEIREAYAEYERYGWLYSFFYEAFEEADRKLLSQWISLGAGGIGSEHGIILMDEEFNRSARITLEQVEGKPWTHAITCGIYGSMFHTAFCGPDDYMEKYKDMKIELAQFLLSEHTDDEEMEFFDEFISKY